MIAQQQLCHEIVECHAIVRIVLQKILQLWPQILHIGEAHTLAVCTPQSITKMGNAPCSELLFKLLCLPAIEQRVLELLDKHLRHPRLAQHNVITSQVHQMGRRWSIHHQRLSFPMERLVEQPQLLEQHAAKLGFGRIAPPRKIERLHPQRSRIIEESRRQLPCMIERHSVKIGDERIGFARVKIALRVAKHRRPITLSRMKNGLQQDAFFSRIMLHEAHIAHAQCRHPRKQQADGLRLR